MTDADCDALSGFFDEVEAHAPPPSAAAVAATVASVPDRPRCTAMIRGHEQVHVSVLIGTGHGSRIPPGYPAPADFKADTLPKDPKRCYAPLRWPTGLALDRATNTLLLSSAAVLWAYDLSQPHDGTQTLRALAGDKLCSREEAGTYGPAMALDDVVFDSVGTMCLVPPTAAPAATVTAAAVIAGAAAGAAAAATMPPASVLPDPIADPARIVPPLTGGLLFNSGKGIQLVRTRTVADTVAPATRGLDVRVAGADLRTAWDLTVRDALAERAQLLADAKDAAAAAPAATAAAAAATVAVRTAGIGAAAALGLGGVARDALLVQSVLSVRGLRLQTDAEKEAAAEAYGKQQSATPAPDDTERFPVADLFNRATLCNTRLYPLERIRHADHLTWVLNTAVVGRASAPRGLLCSAKRSGAVYFTTANGFVYQCFAPLPVSRLPPGTPGTTVATASAAHEDPYRAVCVVCGTGYMNVDTELSINRAGRAFLPDTQDTRNKLLDVDVTQRFENSALLALDRHPRSKAELARITRNTETARAAVADWGILASPEGMCWDHTYGNGEARMFVCCDNGIMRLTLPETADDLADSYRKQLSSSVSDVLPLVLWRVVADFARNAEGFLDAVPLPGVSRALELQHAVQTPSGTLLCTCFETHAIYAVDPHGVELVTCVAGAGAGAAGVGFADGPGARAFFDQPDSLALNERERCVYVSDRRNQMIRRVTLPEWLFVPCAK